MFTNSSPKIYYNKIGTGRPLILLHGNKENGLIFNELINELKDKFTVYAIDARGHGKSEKAESYHYNDMADDVLRVISEEHLNKPYLFGFSDGGIVGLLCGIKAPTVFSKIMVAGANITVDGLSKITRLGMKLSYFVTRDKRTLMMLNEPNIKAVDLNAISCPVLVLAGEKDLIKPEHTKLIADSIPNSSLTIFKGKHHGDYIVHSSFLTKTIEDFINE